MPKLSPEDIRAIFFVDVDGTALKEEFSNGWKNESWFLLTLGFGAKIEDHIRIYSKYRKSITHDLKTDKKLHDQMVADLLEIWTKAWGGNITEIVLIAACNSIRKRISEEFKESIKELIEKKILVIIGTGGFELAAQAIAEELNLKEQLIEKAIDYWFGNTKFIFEKGILKSFEHNKDVPGRKAEQADGIAREIFKIIGKEVPVFAVGDGISDLIIFAHYYGIAFNAGSEELRMAAMAEATDWSGVTNALLAKLNEIEDDGKNSV